MSSSPSVINSPLVNPHRYFYLFLGFFALISLYNLDRLPIAWNDEVQNLDPALVWHHTGIFCSPLWPNPGAENKFLSYPPLIEAWHCLWLFVGKSPWIVRLPFLLFQLIAAGLLYHTAYQLLRNMSQYPNYWSMFFVALFLFDKSTGEVSRGLRVEPMILMLLAYLVFELRKPSNRNTLLRSILMGFTLGALAIAHLYTWPLVGTAFIFYWILLHSGMFQITLPRLALITTFLMPCAFFWYAVQPEWSDIKAQMFMQANDHSSQTVFENFWGFFVGRFWPYSLEQPYTPILHLAYFFLAFKLIANAFKQKTTKTAFIQNTWVAWLYLSLSVPMMLFLSPQHRYFPVQHLLGLYVILSFLHNGIQTTDQHTNGKSNTLEHYLPKCNLKSRWGMALIALMVMAPWTLRHTTAIIQRTQRNPEIVFSFLDQQLGKIPQGEILGEPIAQYWISTQPKPSNWKYGFEFYPQHFPFTPQTPRFFLTKVTPERLPFLRLINRLTIQTEKTSFPLPTKIAQSGHTYQGLYLYQIPSEMAWLKLTSKEILSITSGH